MRNRKFVKLRVDMYSDTKFKIIDTMEERDLIHYIWTRLITLCGKVNLDGDLYMSKTIPYTAETLGVEFNRSVEKIKMALKVFIDLEMIEISKDNVYRISNFAKHQNIKVKEVANNEVYEEKEAEKDCEEVLNKIAESESPTKGISIGEEGIRDVEGDDKEISSNKNSDIDKDKVINFENKCSDLISLGVSNSLNTNKKKSGGRYKKKGNKMKTICSDVINEVEDCVWNDREIIRGDIIETFTF